MIAQPFEIPRTLRLLAEASPQAEPALAIAAPMPEQPRPSGLIDRERELALLKALVERVTETGSALLIRGARGTGKSALVGALVQDLPGRSVRMLRASGIRAEAGLPYAGLHQLLRPVLGELGALPRPQRRAIEAAFRLVAGPPPDPFLIAVATLELLSNAARPGLAIVVEDAQWLDRRTSEVLSFVARRVSSDPIVLLMTARDDRRSPILEAGLDELCLAGIGEEPAAQPVASVSQGASSVDERPLELPAGDPLTPFVMEVWDDLHLGRWAEAASGIEAATELARQTGQATGSVVADVAAALLAAMRGDEETAELALARARSAPGAPGLGWLSSTIEVVRGIADLHAGRADVAYTRLRDQLTGAGDAGLWPVDHLADAAVLTGNVEEAWAVLEARGNTSDGRPGPLHEAGLVYARAVLADEATADAQQALALEALAPWPVHQARLQLHRGAWLRRHRRVAESRVPLRAARDVFETLGAGPLAERARRELRASGERSRRRDVTAWDQLSPQESEIAQLAATGLSNREIGAQLFLSHRTVGAHLYRIFPKLGVTSRGQLHTVLAANVDEAAVARPYGI